MEVLKIALHDFLWDESREGGWRKRIEQDEIGSLVFRIPSDNPVVGGGGELVSDLDRIFYVGSVRRGWCWFGMIFFWPCVSLLFEIQVFAGQCLQTPGLPPLSFGLRTGDCGEV